MGTLLLGSERRASEGSPLWLQADHTLLFGFWRLFQKENFLPLLRCFGFLPFFLQSFSVCVLSIHPRTQNLLDEHKEPVSVHRPSRSSPGSRLVPYFFSTVSRRKLHLHHHLLNSHYELTHSGYKTLSGVKVRASKGRAISHRKDKRPREERPRLGECDTEL